jgi:hypothetical protein
MIVVSFFFTLSSLCCSLRLAAELEHKERTEKESHSQGGRRPRQRGLPSQQREQPQQQPSQPQERAFNFPIRGKFVSNVPVPHVPIHRRCFISSASCVTDCIFGCSPPQSVVVASASLLVRMKLRSILALSKRHTLRSVIVWSF